MHNSQLQPQPQPLSRHHRGCSHHHSVTRIDQPRLLSNSTSQRVQHLLNALHFGGSCQHAKLPPAWPATQHADAIHLLLGTPAAAAASRSILQKTVSIVAAAAAAADASVSSRSSNGDVPAIPTAAECTADSTSSIRAAAQQQSLDTLEWQDVCRQVACFCGTSMASELLQAGRLRLGSSKTESELLLQQTAEALSAQLDVSGVFDLRPALAAAAEGGILNARQLEGVAASMESAFELKAAVQVVAGEQAAATPTQRQQQQQEQQQEQQHNQGQEQQQQQQQQQYLYPTLVQLASGIQEQEHRTLQAIRYCISDAAVLSQASPELAAVREARKANRDKARALATQIAKDVFAQGAAEGREPLLQRGRYCVALKRSRRSAVSKGSVKLGESGTGATLYIEPSELLDLNNREAQLADEETQAELAVLQGLSQFLGERRQAIQNMLAAVTDLDIVAARAKHAQWCQGVRPMFADSSSNGSSGNGSSIGGSSSSGGGSSESRAAHSSPLYLPGARHPLLLQPSLPPLPRPPSSEDGSFETDFIPPPLFAFAAANTSIASSSDSDSDREQGSSSAGQGLGLVRTAKPLDIRVPDKARVVAITGPNTGGKTVTLKTAGLLALMAKAGLFLPCDKQQLVAAAVTGADGSNGGSSGGSSGSGSSGGSSELECPRLLWFDQVLADIGDSQSLQQNLSTFSGHIARLKLLLGAAGQHSLVLLDEVGSGTDPLEGSALARAVLDVLAGQACLTLATSHHAELKTAADEDSRYVNVSLEFNTMTLQPTYRLLWGSAGSSNALDIATALGFDLAVLFEARILARAELGRQEETLGRMEQVAASVEDQLAAARANIASLNAQREQRERDVDALQDKFRQMLMFRGQLQAREKLVKKEAAEAVLSIQQAAVKSRQGAATLEDVQSAVDEYASIISGTSGSGPDAGLQPGDEVVVPSLSAISPFIAPVAKVSGDLVYVKGDLNPFLKKKRGGGLMIFRIDQVVPVSQLQLCPIPMDDEVLAADEQEQQPQPQQQQEQQQQRPEAQDQL